MKFLLFLFIVVLLTQFIKYVSIKESFDNNCFFNYTPNFSLKISDTFSIDENDEINLDENGNVIISNYNLIDESRNVDLSINKLEEDISAILQNPFENTLLNKKSCKFNY